MVKDFTKEDIPVLGRLVSISEDNTVANAEQIWDAKKDQSIQNTVDDINAEIVQLKQSGGLSQEYKNILDYLLFSTNLAEYNTGDWNAEPELFYYPVTFKNPATFDHGQVRIGKGDLTTNDPDGQWYSLVVDGHFPNTDNKAIISYGRNSISGSLDIEGEEGLQALYVSGGNAWFDNDLHTDGDLTVAGDIRYVGGDSFFNGNVNTESNLNVGGELNINSTDNIVLLDDGLTLTQVLDTKQNELLGYSDQLDGGYAFPRMYTNYQFSTYGGMGVQVSPASSQYSQIDIDGGDIIIHGQRKVNINTGSFTVNGSPIYAPQFDPSYFKDTAYGKGIADYYTQDLLGDVYQQKLTSGENIKTINGESLLGSGNISITGGGGTGNVIDNNYVHTDNNFTDAEQSKLAGIAAGAEINVQADWTESDTESDAYILHKPGYLESFEALVTALTTDGHLVTQNDIITVGGITAQDIQTWNRKANAATTISGYNIIYDQAVFEEDENDVFTLNAQYKADHPVRMTSGNNQWTTDGDNKVPTVAAVYDKFLAKDDSTVVKTTGNQTIGGTKTFSVAPIVSGIKASGSNQSGIKLFTTNGSISTLKTINGNSLFGTGDITTTYSNFTAPTNNVAGTAGLVPAPAAGKQNYILGATGWVNPSLLIEDDVTVIITPTDANIRMIMTLAANMSETVYNAAYRLNTSGFTFTIDGQQYSYNQISQMKRSKFKFEFSNDFAYNASTQYGFAITSHKFIPYDHSDMLVIYAIRDDDEAFVFGFASGTFMFGALGPDLQYNKLKIKYNTTDNSNRLFSVLSEFYQVLGMKSDIVDLVSHKLIYDATPVIANLQYAEDNIAFHGLIGSTNMTNDTTGLSFSARPEYGIVEYRNGVLVV